MSLFLFLRPPLFYFSYSHTFVHFIPSGLSLSFSFSSRSSLNPVQRQTPLLAKGDKSVTKSLNTLARRTSTLASSSSSSSSSSFSSSSSRAWHSFLLHKVRLLYILYSLTLFYFVTISFLCNP